MNKILTTRENKGLFYNSALKTRSYSDGKKSNSFPQKKKGDPSETGSLIPREGIKGRGLDPHWVTGLVDAEGSFIVFIKLNPNNSKNLVRQIQLSFEVSFHIKDIELLYKLKSFFLFFFFFCLNPLQTWQKKKKRRRSWYDFYSIN